MDFLSIGGTVVDTFIKLKDASVHCDVDKENCTISMRFADKIPFEFSKVVPAVGNSANAAVSAARLGLKTGYITGLGNDRGGNDCLEVFKREGVSTEYVSVLDGVETPDNYVLWYEQDRTILVKYADFGYDLPTPLPATRALYISSIGEKNLDVHDKIADWLETAPEVMLAFQPATFQMKAGVERLKRVYARTDVFICNKEEYQRILGSAEEDPKKLMEAMRKLGPKVAFLTDGPNGAYALSDDRAWKIGLYPDGENAYERTGAGDAFMGALLLRLAEGDDLLTVARFAAGVGAFAASRPGAQASYPTPDALRTFLA